MKRRIKSTNSEIIVQPPSRTKNCWTDLEYAKKKILELKAENDKQWLQLGEEIKKREFFEKKYMSTADCYIDDIKTYLKKKKRIAPATRKRLEDNCSLLEKQLANLESLEKKSAAKIPDKKIIHLICVNPGDTEQTGLVFLDRYTSYGTEVDNGYLCYRLENWPARSPLKKVERFIVCKNPPKKSKEIEK